MLKQLVLCSSNRTHQVTQKITTTYLFLFKEVSPQKITTILLIFAAPEERKNG